MGLALGETCQFGYLNLGMFVKNVSSGISPDYPLIEKATRLMTRVLDNALEISLARYAHPANDYIMRAKRKIGIGICGFADFLIQLGIPYQSIAAREAATDVLTFINYVSKLESYELAKARGSFLAMNMACGSRYDDTPGFLEKKYGNLNARSVSNAAWIELNYRIKRNRLLRNASTTALPPTGRSGLVVDASTGIEPLFSLVDYSGAINKYFEKDLRQKGLVRQEILKKIMAIGRSGDISQVPLNLRFIYQTALEIPPESHLAMTVAAQRAVDESVSKTINLPAKSSSRDVFDIYANAYDMGLKGITIFRTGSRSIQPRKVATL